LGLHEYLYKLYTLNEENNEKELSHYSNKIDYGNRLKFDKELSPNIDRFNSNPLITTDTDNSIGKNINGPSIIRAPDWIKNPLGNYYMYFGHHGGSFIRLAYSNSLEGPWNVYPPGTLHLNDTQFDVHIASPDVHVDSNNEKIVMYYHGRSEKQFDIDGYKTNQATDVAVSNNGIKFESFDATLGTAYFRVWKYNNKYYSIGDRGHLFVSNDMFEPFKRKQEIFPKNRHFAVRKMDNDLLQVFLSRRGDRPERLMVSYIDLSLPHEKWRADPHPPESVLWPLLEYEGGNEPIEPYRGYFGRDENAFYRELRDPAVFEENNETYLFYSFGGEKGIAGGKLIN